MTEVWAKSLAARQSRPSWAAAEPKHPARRDSETWEKVQTTAFGQKLNTACRRIPLACSPTM